MRNWPGVVEIESCVTKAAGVWLAAKEAEEPVEQALRRSHTIGVAIRAKERNFQGLIHGEPLRILNVDAQSVSGF